MWTSQEKVDRLSNRETRVKSVRGAENYKCLTYVYYKIGNL